MQEEIIRNLNAVLEYQCTSEKLDALKRALRGLSGRLAEATKTTEGMRRWQRDLESALSGLGEVQYTGGDPYGGGGGEFVQTTENVMRAFVHAKGRLCAQDAARIAAQRDDEERASMPSIEETQGLVRAFCACVEALATWKESSGLEQKFGGRKLLAYGREAVELSRPGANYLRGMGARPTTAQVRALVEELEAAAEFANGERCRGEVRDTDRASWRTQVLACVPALKAYVDRVDPQGRWIFGAAERRLMDFAHQKARDCLQRVGAVEYTSTWKAEAFATIREACGKLREQLGAAKTSEASLLAWRERLGDASSTFGGAMSKFNGTVPSAGEPAISSSIMGEMQTCRKLITEMLRILNPGEKKYQIWFELGDRERFLKDTGFQEGRMPAMAEISGLLSRLQELAA